MDSTQAGLISKGPARNLLEEAPHGKKSSKPGFKNPDGGFRYGTASGFGGS
jgi:hypothetical protein